MVSKRERKIQFLIQEAKYHCNHCACPDWVFCMRLCSWHRIWNERLLSIIDNGGDTA